MNKDTVNLMICTFDFNLRGLWVILGKELKAECGQIKASFYLT
ncbi:hypothetical protein U9R62_12040 [Cylindrospermopsis raciborskii DSH]